MNYIIIQNVGGLIMLISIIFQLFSYMIMEI